MRDTSRRALLAGAGPAAAALLAGCGGGDGDGTATTTDPGDGNVPTVSEVTEGPLRVDLSLGDRSVPLQSRLAAAFTGERADEDSQLTDAASITDAGGDPATQADQLRGAAEAGARAVLLAGIDDPAVATAVDELSVPVVLLGEPTAPPGAATTAAGATTPAATATGTASATGTDGPTSSPATTTAPGGRHLGPDQVASMLVVDPVRLGAGAAELLLDLLEAIDLRNMYGVVTVGRPGERGPAADRRLGFQQIVAGKFTMRDRGVDTATDAASAESAVAALIEAAEDPVHGVFATDPELAVGADRAVEGADPPLAISTVGRSAAFFDRIAATGRYGTVLPNAGWLFGAGLENARRAIRGVELSPTTAVGGAGVTAENLEEYRGGG